jgi:hypothetical protein
MWWRSRQDQRDRRERDALERRKMHEETIGHARRQGRLSFVQAWVAGAALLVAIVGIAVTVMLSRDDGSQVSKPESRGGAPVRALVETDPARIYAGLPEWQTYDLVAPVASAGLGAPPSARCRDWRTWAQRRGAVDADETLANAYLQARSGAAVIIDGIEIDVVRRRLPVEGTSAHCPAGGAVGNPRLIDVDLDADPPEVLYAEAGDDYPARRGLNFTLTDSETETFQFRAHTRKCDCEWRARVQMVVDGKRTEVPLDEDGRPFRTSSSRRADHVEWTGSDWASISREDWRATLPMRWGDFVRRQGG